MGTPPSSSSNKESKKPEKSIFIRKREGHKALNQHLYKLPEHDQGPVLEKKPIQPFIAIPSLISSGAAFVAYNSCIIYAFNGEYRCISPEVFYLDVRNVDEGWRKGPSMSRARPDPYAIVSNGKIYVMGTPKDRYPRARHGNDDDTDDDDVAITRAHGHWGEVLDPLMNVWVEFIPHPNLMSYNIESHAVLESRKQILVQPSVHDHDVPLYSYDIDSEHWKVAKTKFGSCYYGCSNYVVLDGLLYYYLNGDVRAYDATSNKRIDGGVRGFNKLGNVVLPTSIDRDSQEKVFLVNLGNGRLCLIWINHRHLRSYFWKKYVRCTKFRVIKHSGDEGITLHALIDSFSEYTLGGLSEESDDRGEIVDCFAM